MTKNIIFIVLSCLITNNFFSQNEFIKNEGQLIDYNGDAHPEILYYNIGKGLNTYFTTKGVSYYFSKTNNEAKTDFIDKKEEEKYYDKLLTDSTFYYRLDMNFNQANKTLKISSNTINTSYNNYYYPHCKDGILSVETSLKIKYENVYNNIDFEFYFNKGSLKYDIILHPNANINDIKLHFDGAEDIRLAQNELIIFSPIGEIKETLPKSFIQKENQLIDKKVKYNLENNVVSFELPYNNENKLIIDPQITWSTYYSDFQHTSAVSGVRGDQLVISGNVNSSNIMPPLNPGGGAYFQNSQGGGLDIYILKFDTNGVKQWATYYGGSGNDFGYYDVEINSLGDVYIAGSSRSTNIPTQNPGGGAYYDGTYSQGAGPFTASGWDYYALFLMRFNSLGVRQWATHYDYLSGPMITIDNNDNVYIVGGSLYTSPSVQSLAGAYNQATVTQKSYITNPSANNASGDIFIAKFNPSNQRIWATNLGGNTSEGAWDITTDNTNNLYIVGSVGPSNGTTTGFVKANPGGGAYYNGATLDATASDFLLYKFSPTGGLIWGTVFGGSESEAGDTEITIDGNNNITIGGSTRSNDIPFVNPGGGAHFDNTINHTGPSSYSYFLARFNSSLQLIWSTYYYGHKISGNFPMFLKSTSDNRLIVALHDQGANLFPNVLLPNSYNQTMINSDIHISEFNTNLSLNWATYLGSQASDFMKGMEITANNNYSMFVVGSSYGALNYPLVNPGGGAYFDNTDSITMFITKFSSVICDTTTNTTSTASICETGTKTLVGTPAGGVWSIVNGGGSITGTTYTAPSVSSNTNVTVRYKITGSGSCPDDSTDVTFTVNNAVSTINSTTTDSICELGTKTLVGTPAGGVWSIVSGGGSITGTTYTAPNVSANTTITIKYRTPGTGGCPADSANVIFTVEPTIIPTITSSNAPMCIGDTLVLTGTPVGGTWSVLSGGGSVTGNVLTATGSVTIQVQYRVANACGNNDVTQNITISSSIAVAITSSTASLCDNQTRVLTGTPTGGMWNVISGPATELGGVLTPTGAGIVSVEYAVASSCGNGTDTVDIVINPAPNASAGLDENICVGDTVTLTATGGGTYQWNPGPATSINQVFPAVTTGYRVDVTSDSGCVASDTVTVFIQTSGTATAQNDQAIVVTGIQEIVDIYTNDVGGINTLTILSGPSNGTGTISGGNVLYTSTAGYIGTDTVEYEICDANCQVVCDTAYLYLTIESDLVIPIGVSVNGDGKNDVFNILGLSRYPNNSIAIYNRWGSLVFQASPYLNNWNGQISSSSLMGNEVIEGTYFHILKLGEGLPTYNGYIELKK